MSSSASACVLIATPINQQRRLKVAKFEPEQTHSSITAAGSLATNITGSGLREATPLPVKACDCLREWRPRRERENERARKRLGERELC